MHWPEISFSVEETFSTSLPRVAFLTAWEKWLCSLIYIFNSLLASWTHGSSKQESRLLSVLSSPFFPLSNRTSSSKPRRVVVARGTGVHGQWQYKRCLRSLDPSTWSLSLSQAAASSWWWSDSEAFILCLPSKALPPHHVPTHPRHLENCLTDFCKPIW